MNAAAVDWSVEERADRETRRRPTVEGVVVHFRRPQGMQPEGGVSYGDPVVPAFERMPDSPDYVALHAMAGGSYFGGMTTGLEADFDLAPRTDMYVEPIGPQLPCGVMSRMTSPHMDQVRVEYGD